MAAGLNATGGAVVSDENVQRIAAGSLGIILLDGEGVLAAAALRAMGGELQGRLCFRNEQERERAIEMGIKDPDKVFTTEELASGDVIFSATGVTDGDFLQGIRFYAGGATSHSVVMRSASGTIRYVQAHHDFARGYGMPRMP